MFLSLSASTYYVAPNGNDSNTGSINQPFFTLKKVWTVLFAGDIVYLRGGTYYYNSDQSLIGKNGTSANPITIMAYPGEKPVITKSSSYSYRYQAGIYFEGNYFHWKGITVSGYEQTNNDIIHSMIIQYSSHNIIENMVFSYSCLGFDLSHGSDDNLLLNCDFHHNYNPISDDDAYGSADGANAHTDQGTTNTFRNCRFWSNSDDGIDLYNGDGLIILDGCWSWLNGFTENGSKGGDGFGFKLGVTSRDFSSDHLRTITNCMAFYNRLGGFGINHALCIVWMFNNTAFHNSIGDEYSLGFAFDDHEGIYHILQNNLGYDNQNSRGLDANWTSECTVDHNSWDSDITLNNADFISTDSSGVSSPRDDEGNLPNLNFMKLAAGSDLIDAGTDVGIAYNGNAPDIGAYEFGSYIPPSPLYSSSSIENLTPTLLQINYNLALRSSAVPSISAFNIKVNSVARTVNSISISGTRVSLTLANAVVYGDVITVTYTKPSTNPVQSIEGAEVASLADQRVTNRVNSVNPVYIGSSVENATPAILGITYSLTLANKIPPASAFKVLVNSVSRTVSSVAVSGTKVSLTLAIAVIYGDVITVAYTKPSTNTLQTSAGAEAASLANQNVTNNVKVINPAYVSSSIENASPAILSITFNLTLANKIPVASAFKILVNTVTRTVKSVAITASKVQLTLTSPVVYGDIVVLSYTKPVTNPIQTSSGGIADNIVSKTVTNNVAKLVVVVPPVTSSRTDPYGLVLDYPATVYEGFINAISVRAIYKPANDSLNFEWSIPNGVSVSNVKSRSTQFLAPVVTGTEIVKFKLRVTDGKTILLNDIPITVLPYKPQLSAARITTIEASDSQSPNLPANIIDGNTSTKWSSNGDKKWLIVKFSQPFKISHLVLGFLPGQKYESIFDVYASKDKLTWEPILTNVSSCGFSGERQIFDFPVLNSTMDFLYLKYVGHGNTLDKWNNISELKVFGSPASPISYDKKNIIVYPNPVQDYLNITFEETKFEFDRVRIIDYSGRIVLEKVVNPLIKTFQFPINLKSGNYLVDLGLHNLVLYSQKLIVQK